MTVRSDLHLHTTFCDGKHTPREMIEQAIALGYHTLGLCCHSTLPFANDWSAQNERAFKEEIAALKAAYKGRISICCGIECDNESALTAGFDYVIGSVHHLRAGDKVYPVDESAKTLLSLLNEGFGGNKDALADAYFKAVVENVRRLRPTVLGHFDLLTKYAEAEPSLTFDSPAYFAAGKAALAEIFPLCPILEVNFGALSRLYRTSPYPSDVFLSYWQDLGGKVILTSDAHSKEALVFDTEKAESVLRRAAYSSRMELKDGALVDVPL